MYRLDNESAGDSVAKKMLRITGVVILYWSVSITLVFTNKYLLKSEELKLDAPLFVTWFQCVVTCVMTVICAKMGWVGVTRDIPFDVANTKANCRKVLPVSIAFVSMVTFNNLCLAEVGVAFYTIARSQVTLFSLLFMYLILGVKTSFKAILCCTVIVGGFLLGVNQEGDLGSLSVIGTIYGVVASACVALNAIYMKKVLPLMNGDIWATAYYNNINACVIFFPFILVIESTTLFRFPALFSLAFWGPMTVAGTMGFFMGYVVGLQIKVTSPLTHNISGVAKACFQTLIATLWYSTPKPFLWWVSTLAVLGGTSSYSIVKSLEMKKNQNQTSEKQPLMSKA